ncbi:threonine--tRNA ligase [Paenibacillus campi]|uniref:threonine--tRNA ligase n=1 Tax=Paenibacillus campi TaxID=3106031 RepID=UPI002AFE2CAA|nr:threonine--tRNA ligase [Paenibacillus sp. SGZ-1009]
MSDPYSSVHSNVVRPVASADSSLSSSLSPDAAAMAAANQQATPLAAKHAAHNACTSEFAAASVRVELPNGSVRSYPGGESIAAIARSISPALGKRALAGLLNGQLVDLNTAVLADAQLEIITAAHEASLSIYRISAAHLLAQAVQRLYGAQQVKLGGGSATEQGFYYDIELEHSLSESDLPALEQMMKQIAAENGALQRRVLEPAVAMQLFDRVQQPYQLQHLDEIIAAGQEAIVIYEQGDYVVLENGPLLPSFGRLQAFRLMSVAGAYWRGDSSGAVLQRIQGVAFAERAELEQHWHWLQEARRRDHRRLGRELKLFMFSDEAPGMPFYLPKGMLLRTELEQFSRQQQLQRGYEEVRTPFMMNQQLWEQSGHWDHYKDNMYFSEVDGEHFALKPMNCPGHMLIYKHELRSYRELPIRMMEFGQVHRHEFSGALNGLMRVRTFCQDDAHIYALPEQIEAEIANAMELIDDMYNVFGFQYEIELSTRPDDYMGAEELWDQAEQALRNVLEARGVQYRINEGDGAFYGPKIDFHILDALRRSWQCGTIQLDFQMPEKFDLSYVGEDNAKYRPVVIHRAIYGSLDRFIGILTEHYAGAFPLWLAPVQVKVLPVSGHYEHYALQVKSLLLQAGIRAELDRSGNKLGYKMREAQQQKIPYLLVVGEQEQQTGQVNVRKHGEHEQQQLPLVQLIDMLQAAMLQQQQRKDRH